MRLVCMFVISVAAAKSLQSCPTLCDPTDGSPPGSPHPWDSPGKNTGVDCHFLLQCMKVKVKVKSLSRVRLFATPWTVAYQAPQSMGFSRQVSWIGLPSSQIRGQTCVPCICRQIPNHQGSSTGLFLSVDDLGEIQNKMVIS